MREIRAAQAPGFALVVLGLMIALSGCAARTFKVLDTTTGEPVAGAAVHITARGIAPIPLPHPANITLAEWDLKSDKDGEVHLSSIWADHASADFINKPGYRHASTVQEYIYRGTANANRDVSFLTPEVDLAYEGVRYWLYITELAMDKGEGTAGQSRISIVTNTYPLAKRIAKADREIEVLRQYCRFALAMRAQRAAGWPDMGTRPEPRVAGQELIEDCDEGRLVPQTPPGPQSVQRPPSPRCRGASSPGFSSCVP